MNIKVATFKHLLYLHNISSGYSCYWSMPESAMRGAVAKGHIVHVGREFDADVYLPSANCATDCFEAGEYLSEYMRKRVATDGQKGISYGPPAWTLPVTSEVMDAPVCEICGEHPLAVKTNWTGYCVECAAKALDAMPDSYDANYQQVGLVMTAAVDTTDGRGKWQIFTMPNGDTIFGCYPHGDTCQAVAHNCFEK